MTIGAPAVERTHALQHELGAGAASSWHVQVNLDALNHIIAPDGTRIHVDPGIPLSGTELYLSIPAREEPLRLLIDTIHEGFGGVVNHAGVIDGDDGSLVVISVKGDEILGKVHHSEGFTYLIEGSRNYSGHVLSVIDQTLIPRSMDKHEVEAGLVSDRSNSSRPVHDIDDDLVHPASASGEVRLLVLYTPAVAAKPDVNINLMANNIVSGFNQSLQLSGVSSSNYVTLADVRSIGNNLATLGSRCNNEIVKVMMADRSGPFSQLDAWMEVAFADIALAIVTNEPGYTECGNGSGRFGGQALFIDQYPDHTEPFANTTDTFALADLTAIHEVGHVLNGMHEHQCYLGTVPSYACGYAPSHCNWQTIMGGYGQCSFDAGKPPGQQPTLRIARWSNPNILYNDEPTGVHGQFGPTARRMADALNYNMVHAAKWKGVQASPPSPPDPISVTSGYCWGFNTVQWATHSSAAEYRLFQSHSPSFSSPFLVYSGPGPSANINVSQTAYLRAKACNSGGCSAYSAQVVAQYFQGCM